VEPEQLLLHTDQGSQYRATDYHDLLRQREIVCSMSAKGCCWDNAVVESFFSTMKLDLNLDDHRQALISPQQLQRDLTIWIEGYYNRERGHSTLGYLSSIDYEQQLTLPVHSHLSCFREHPNSDGCWQRIALYGIKALSGGSLDQLLELIRRVQADSIC
jgi:putative transposase